MWRDFLFPSGLSNGLDDDTPGMLNMFKSEDKDDTDLEDEWDSVIGKSILEFLSITLQVDNYNKTGGKKEWECQ